MNWFTSTIQSLKALFIAKPLPIPKVVGVGKKKATLQRRNDDGVQTVGKLIMSDENSLGINCDTLELPYKNNEHDISCIPTGTYTCKWTFSQHFQKYTYEVMNVFNRQGIRIHAGNYNKDSLGCILLGQGYGDLNNDGEKDILNSREALDTFETFMAKEDFELTITAPTTV